MTNWKKWTYISRLTSPRNKLANIAENPKSYGRSKQLLGRTKSLKRSLSDHFTSRLLYLKENAGNYKRHFDESASFREVIA
jgi:hypothetical protein